MTNLEKALIQHWYPRNRIDADLAGQLDVNHTLISKWKHNRCKMPMSKKILVAQILGVDSRLLFPDDDAN